MGALFPGPVLAALAESPDWPAFETGPRTVSCGELLATVRRLAGGLRNAASGKPDKRALLGLTAAAPPP